MKLDGYYPQDCTESTIIAKEVHTSGRDSCKPISSNGHARERLVCIHLNQIVLFEVIKKPVFILFRKVVRIDANRVFPCQLFQNLQLFISKHVHRCGLTDGYDLGGEISIPSLLFFRWLNRRRFFATAYLVFCMWWWGDAHAAYSPDIPEAYVVAAETHSVPPDILYALALNESQVQLAHAIRPWPWTLNVEGKGYHFADRHSACEALYEALGRTQIVDVGIAQLNFRWQPQLFGAGNRFVDPCDALDPYANLEEAAGLLRQHYEDSGDWLMAAGRYHRPVGGEAAARYRRGITTQLARLDAGGGPRPNQDASIRFSSAADIELPATAHSAPQSHSTYSAHISEPYQPVAIDHSLHWVVPSEVDPVSWIDPEVRWDWLVSAVVQ